MNQKIRILISICILVAFSGWLTPYARGQTYENEILNMMRDMVESDLNDVDEVIFDKDMARSNLDGSYYVDRFRSELGSFVTTACIEAQSRQTISERNCTGFFCLGGQKLQDVSVLLNYELCTLPCQYIPPHRTIKHNFFCIKTFGIDNICNHSSFIECQVYYQEMEESKFNSLNYSVSNDLLHVYWDGNLQRIVREGFIYWNSNVEILEKERIK